MNAVPMIAKCSECQNYPIVLVLEEWDPSAATCIEVSHDLAPGLYVEAEWGHVPLLVIKEEIWVAAR